MFGPSRGPWTDDGWNGWWGPNPPYHAPTFVLTHHPREPIPMDGGTTFHFATQGIDDTLEQAFAAANGRDVRLMGGAATVRQYLSAGLIHELHLMVVPMLIGRGERIFAESSPPPGYTCSSTPPRQPSSISASNDADPSNRTSLPGGKVTRPATDSARRRRGPAPYRRFGSRFRRPDCSRRSESAPLQGGQGLKSSHHLQKCLR